MPTILPKIKISLEKCNFVFQASSIWNAVIGKLMNKCKPNNNGILIPGMINGSDLTTPVSIIKRKLKCILLEVQKLDTSSQFGWAKTDEWHTENFFRHC